MLKKIIGCCFLLVLLVACHARKDGNAEQKTADNLTPYCSWLRIMPQKAFIVCEVRNPWQPQSLLERYVLVKRGNALPDSLPQGTVVRIPLQHAAVFSSVHAALLEELGALPQISGICDTRYVLLPTLQQALAQGRLADLGNSMQPDLERIAAAHSDALMVSPFEHAGHGALTKLRLPIIACADYMETSPLGRAQWSIFYGLLFGRQAQADSLFESVQRNYAQLCEKVKDRSPRPSLMSDKKTGNSWWMPGGKSYLSKLYADAGTRHCFADRAESGSIALDFETVWAKAHAADIWLIKDGTNAPLTYELLGAEFPPYRRFKAFEDRHIWFCNTLQVPYFEEIPFHPDRLLQDIIKIAHPEVLPDVSLRYYHPLS